MLFSFIPNKIRFKEWHLKSRVIKPLIITPKYISIGNNVVVLNDCRIQGVDKYNDVFFNPNIIIDDGVSIQQEFHLTCANEIIIGKNTAIAAHVTITDIHHPYTDINMSIEDQDIEVKSVCIGQDCKLYNGAVILPGVTIGNHVTVGANSVVNINIPDYSIVVGLPARIVKRYNFNTQNWEKTDKYGNFIKL